MKINIKGLAALCLGIAVLYSCGSPKKYAYMQDVELLKKYSVEHDTNLKVMPGDRIAITVLSSYPELVRPFNGGGFDTSVPGVATNKAGGTANPAEHLEQVSGYLVNSAGEINFPVLGNIKVEGMTLEQIRVMIEQRIVESKYVPDPRINIDLANFRVYLLGAVFEASGYGYNSQANYASQYGYSFSAMSGIAGGVLRVANQPSVNILEVISFLGGNLPINANLEKVNIIRRENGKYVTYRMNLKSVDIFNSPGFYLRQNDIVYVEARYRRSEMESIERVLQIAGYLTSTITSVVAITALLRK